MQRIGRFIRDRPGPRAVQHGDYRLDNMLFGTAEGGHPLAVVDWQTVVWGPPAFDASYFLGAGLPVDDRRRHERADGLARAASPTMRGLICGRTTAAMRSAAS
jgi:aminoglycoside phosphotransferase (APT) family kinase protein